MNIDEDDKDDEDKDEGNGHIGNYDKAVDKADGGRAMMTMGLTKSMVT